MKRFILYVALAGYAFANSVAYERALEHNPQLRALYAQLQALETEVTLASLWENPTLALEVMDIPFDKPLTRNQEMQSESISLTQVIPTGSKRTHAATLARQEVEIKALEIVQQRLWLALQIGMLEQKHWQLTRDLALTKEALALLDTLLALRLSYNATSSQFSQSVALTLSQKTLEVEKRTLERAQATLVRELEQVVGTFASFSPTDTGILPFAFKVGVEDISSNPQLQAALLKSRQGQTLVALEASQKTPDVMLKLGYNRREGKRDDGFLEVGFSLPLYGRETLRTHKAHFAQTALDEEATALRQRLTFELHDTLLERQLQEEKIALYRALVAQSETLYAVLEETAFSQPQSLPSLLEALQTQLEAKKLLSEAVYGHNAAVLQMRYLLGVLP